MRDSVTVIAYNNHMGGIKSETCNNIACRIWNFCAENKLWVSPAHIPDKDNIERDQQSRILQDANENFIEKYFKNLLINLENET